MGLHTVVLWVVAFNAVIQITSSATTSCGENLCLCREKSGYARCEPGGGSPSLPFFPRLPTNITEVMFSDYKLQNLSVVDLKNLTYLFLNVLRLRHMDIEYMEKGLFQSLPHLKTLEISFNKNLSSAVLRDSFQGITSNLQELIVSSNNFFNISSNIFKYLSHANLKALVLAKNPMLQIKKNIFERLHVQKLDLSFTSFDNLTTICPEKSFPLFASLRHLRLQRTKFTRISQNVFGCFPNLEILHLGDNGFNVLPSICEKIPCHQNKSKIKLKKLFLQNTGLRGNVSIVPLECLNSLTFLDLSRNKINNIPVFCNSQGISSFPNLENLYLQDTSITYLRRDSFKCLQSLQNIYLKSNILKQLPNFCMRKNLSYTPELTKLSLQNTSIVTLRDYKFRCLRRLKILNLRNNIIKEIPSFCNELNDSINPYLAELYLSSNKIQNIFIDSFRCLFSLRILDLSYNPIFKLDDNIFSPLISLKKLEIENSKSLKKINKYAFNISSLIILKFTSNDFNFEDETKYSPENLFRFCENVETLILSGNHFPTTNLAQLILRPLKKLTYLSLANNRMHTIYEDTLRSSRTLQILLLGQNRITGWNKNVFNNVSKLTDLDLANNEIAVFNKTSVPMNILNSLETFTLAYNPFNCGCDMIWFKNWSMTTKVTMLDFPMMYSCKTPPSMFRKPLMSLHLTEEDCKEKNLWLIVTVSVSAGALLLLCISITVFVQMPTIKNYVYYLRLKKMEYVKLINEQEFSYDAHVVYCESDENWIIRNLIPNLVCEGIRMCIPDREFEVGANKSDQIVSAFRESKKILVILSDNFARNEWCLWQMELVEERLRQSGDSAAVFVLYKSISSKNMISSLHRTIKKRRIVTWHEGGGREKVFWKVVVLALRAPLGEPPISVIH